MARGSRSARPAQADVLFQDHRTPVGRDAEDRMLAAWMRALGASEAVVAHFEATGEIAERLWSTEGGERDGKGDG